MIHDFRTNNSDGRLIYTSIDESHAKYTFARLIDSGKNMELTYLRLNRIETDDDGIVHHEETIRAGWVKNARGPYGRDAIASRIHT